MHSSVLSARQRYKLNRWPSHIRRHPRCIKAWQWDYTSSLTFLFNPGEPLSLFMVLINCTQTEPCAAASCHLSLCACYRSLFARGLSIDSRAYVISLHACRPIRTLGPNCANQDVWVVTTPKGPTANSIHTAVWHAWTRTPSLNIVQKAVFSLILLPPNLPVFGHRAILIWGIETWLGFFRKINRILHLHDFHSRDTKLSLLPLFLIL